MTPVFNLFQRRQGTYKDDILSGLTVALALVPEAIAFSFLAGVNPMVGLWSAVFVGLITSSMGGRPGMISGATGAIAIVAAKAVELGEIEGGTEMGLKYLLVTLMLAGVIQLGAGALKLGRFIRLVPHPVMIGFVNGLAIVIFLGQLGFFKKSTGIDSAGSPINSWLQGPELWLMIGLVVATMLIIHFLPRVTKALPSALAAILVVGGLGALGAFDARVVVAAARAPDHERLPRVRAERRWR